MARCELAIKLDGDRKVFRGGESVSGQVVVSVDEDVRCDGLVVELSWGTLGEALSSSGPPQKIELFQGELTGGAVLRFPFSFRLPAGPVSYRGRHVELRWFLDARADVPWKVDPASQIAIDLEANPDHALDWPVLFEPETSVPAFLRQTAGQGVSDQEDEADGFTTSRTFSFVDIGCLGVALLFVILGGWSLFNTFWALFGGATSWSEELSRMALEAGFFLVSLAIAVWFIRSRIASARLGKVRLEIEPRLLRPGQTVRLQVHGTPAKNVELEGGTCRLDASERVVAEKTSRHRSSELDDTNWENLFHRVHREETEIFEAQSLPARQPFQLQGDITVPADAAPTFVARTARLEWEIKLTLRVKGWPKWEAHRKIVVHP